MDRQKIIWIFIAAWISAALLTWFLYATTQAPHSEKLVAITAAARDMPAGTRLQKADLKTVRVPEKDLPKAAILDQRIAIDRPLLFPVGANEAIGPSVGVSSAESGRESNALSVAVCTFSKSARYSAFV